MQRFLDIVAAHRASLDLTSRLAAGGRTRVVPEDILDHLEFWEPETLPAAVRDTGAASTVLTAFDVSPNTRRLLTAYAALPLAFHVVECADAE